MGGSLPPALAGSFKGFDRNLGLTTQALRSRPRCGRFGGNFNEICSFVRGDDYCCAGTSFGTTRGAQAECAATCGDTKTCRASGGESGSESVCKSGSESVCKSAAN